MSIFPGREREKPLFLDALRTAAAGVEHLHRTERSHAKAHRPFVHPLNRLMVMLEGGGHVYDIARDGQLVPLTLMPGQALFSPRFGVTRTIQHKKTRIRMLTLVFFPGFLRYLISEDPNKGSDSHFWYHSAAPLGRAALGALQSLNETAAMPHLPADIGRRLAEVLLGLCLDHLEREAAPPAGKGLLTYLHVKNHMMENLHLPINRASVARQTRLTPSHISRLFGRYDDYNFNQALRRLRLEHAHALLLDTQLSVDEIAEQCGFSSSGYFIKSFAAHYGRTPGSLRADPTNASPGRKLSDATIG